MLQIGLIILWAKLISYPPNFACHTLMCNLQCPDGQLAFWICLACISSIRHLPLMSFDLVLILDWLQVSFNPNRTNSLRTYAKTRSWGHPLLLSKKFLHNLQFSKNFRRFTSSSQQCTFSGWCQKFQKFPNNNSVPTSSRNTYITWTLGNKPTCNWNNTYDYLYYFQIRRHWFPKPGGQ